MSRIRWVLSGLVLVALAVALPWLVPLPARLAASPSPVIRYQDGQLAHASLAQDDRWRLATRLEATDPAYLDALLALEDRRFRWHPGVDPIAVVRAAGQDLLAGEVVSGASTLTMQLVRVLEPRPRTLGSKVVEALRALQLEARLSKDEILAAYTTFVPFGRNLEGVEAASWALFGHSPAALSAEEIVTLLAIPQDPCGRYPRPGSEERLRSARLRATERLLAAGLLAEDAAQARDLLARVAFGPQPTRLRSMPREIPHAAAWMKSRRADTLVTTTLDRATQRGVEAVLAGRRRALAAQGIHDVAVVVVDHRSASVRALVGGFDFGAPRSGAQIPAFAQPRSPGSTLKPFILARAVDRGLALPGTVVLDLPQRYGGYVPRNYDGGYRGSVRLDTALSQSLNAPFVALLDRVGIQDLLGLLRSGGAGHLVGDPARYGLSLAVGGAELTPLELAELYTMLAHDGAHRPLRWRGDQPEFGGLSLLSPGAAWLTRGVLSQRDRPDFPLRAELAAGPLPFHFKTGTSHANRDAWAAGSGSRFTVIVWLGNLDGSGSAHLVGGRSAAPLLFDLLEALEGGEVASDDPIPEDLVSVRTCPPSGLPAGPACPHAVTALAPRDAVPQGACPLHVALELDVATGERVGPGCRAGRQTRRVVRVVQPPALRRWQARQGVVQDPLPPLAAACSLRDPAPPPRIVQPGLGAVVVLVPGLAPGSQELPLAADLDQPDGPLWWYVDGTLVARASADQQAWWTPVPGRHEIVVLASDGTGDRRWIEVLGEG